MRANVWIIGGALLRWPRDGILIGLARMASIAVGSTLPIRLYGGWLVAKLKPHLPSLTSPPTQLERTLVARVVHFCDPGPSYDPFGRIPGKLGVTPFRCSELGLTRRRGKGQTETVFSGLFFAAEFHKSFRGRLVVLPDRLERRLGHLARALHSIDGSRGLDLVELEDPEFEERFVVSGSDPIEARYILTPDLMQRIRRLGGDLGSGVRLAFLRGYVFVAFPLPGNLFGPQWWQGRVEEADVQAWVSELAFVTSLVEALDLNTRIS